MLALCNPGWDTKNKCLRCTNIAMEDTRPVAIISVIFFRIPRGVQERWQVNDNCLSSKCSERRATAILTCSQLRAS